MRTITDYKINSKIEKWGEVFINASEYLFEDRTGAAVDKIIEAGPEAKPIVLISGPSGSGKTTSALKICRELKDRGYSACCISMDKYFKDFTDEERELKKQGKIDLESPDRVDKEYLHKDLKILFEGGSIRVPEYDFPNNKRTLTDSTISLNGGFLIIEGIHALNPDVLGDIDDVSTRVYVSVRTRLIDADGDRLTPSKIRLMRRMMRDKLYRSRDLADTIKMYPSVQRGENQFIMPYKPRANVSIDTFLDYEPAIFKKYLYEDICTLSEKYADVRDIVKALDRINPLSTDGMPSDALMREFIGGSVLEY